MGSGYTAFSFGPVIFFLITAISSVAWLTLAMSVAIKGIAIVPEKKSTFNTLFFTAAIFAAIFFFAVMKYEWLGGATPYDGLYHSFGFVGSIVVGLYAVKLADANNIKSSGVGLLPFVVAVGFLIINSLLTPSYYGESSYESYVIGFLYASIQFFYPLVYYFYINKPENKQAAIDKRNVKMGIAPVPAFSTQTTATSSPRAESLNAAQDTTNRK